MRSRLHSRLAAVLILGLSAHGAGAEFPLSAGLTGQALQRLPGKNRALPKRTFLRTAFRSTIEASVRQPITTYRLGKAIYRQRGVALLEDNLPVRVSLTFMPGAPPRPGGRGRRERGRRERPTGRGGEPAGPTAPHRASRIVCT